MHYLESDILFTGNSEPIKSGILVVDSHGNIVDVLKNKGLVPAHKIKKIDGALCPGFINTHCHLELSHLKSKLERETGLPAFISQIPHIRKTEQQLIDSEIEKADAQMRQNGIVAVADISNTNHTFKVKENSSIYYHTFIELFSLNPELANQVFDNGLQLEKQCNTPSSLVPHANYSVSNELFALIKNYNRGGLLSIHNQETETEDRMFLDRSGLLFETLTNVHYFTKTGKSAIRSTLPHLPNAKTLLVHNTFSSLEDMKWVNSNSESFYWCTCPKANLYIENRLPNYADFAAANCKITIGTDSLASNDSLSILEEMIVISKCQNVDINTLIMWACKNGAEFLGLDDLGTFAKGKNPGINVLTQLSDTFELTSNTKVRPLNLNDL